MTFGADCGRQTVMIIQEVADMKIAVCIKQVPDTDDVKTVSYTHLHTEEVLKELGYSRNEIDCMEAEQAVKAYAGPDI